MSNTGLKVADREPVKAPSVFGFEGNSVRTVIGKDGEPWVVGVDVLRALGYEESSINSSTKLFEKIPPQWIDRLSPETDSGSVDRALTCLSEQGLYFFLGRSDKPKAIPFQIWIADEVLPAIRKHGMYATPDTVEKLLGDPDAMIRILQALKEERAAKEKAIAEKDEFRRIAAAASQSAKEDEFFIMKLLNEKHGLPSPRKDIDL